MRRILTTQHAPPIGSDGIARGDGLVRTAVGRGDRRNLLISQTSKGAAIVAKATEPNAARFHAAFALLSLEELATLTALALRAW